MKTSVDIKGMKELTRSLGKMTGLTMKELLHDHAEKILSSAMKNTPVASKKSIIRRTMPQGIRYNRVMGNRLVTMHEDGKKYHVGEPRKGFNGKGYIVPYTYWMNKNRPSEFYKGRTKGKKVIKERKAKTPAGDRWRVWLEGQKAKTNVRVMKRGLSKSQFFWMARMINLKINAPTYLKKSARTHLPIVAKFLSPRKGRAGKYGYNVLLRSTGFKMSGVHDAQGKIVGSMKARHSTFMRKVRKEFLKEIKYMMPQKYPLLFK